MPLEDDINATINYYKQKVLSWLSGVSIPILGVALYPQGRIIFGFILMAYTVSICAIVFSILLLIARRTIGKLILKLSIYSLELFGFIGLIYFISLFLEIPNISNFLDILATNHLCHTYIGETSLCTMSDNYSGMIIDLIAEITNNIKNKY